MTGKSSFVYACLCHICISNDYRTISDRAEAMLDLMNDYPSYSGKAEGMTGVTAFIIRTEAVEAPESPEATETPEAD